MEYATGRDEGLAQKVEGPPNRMANYAEGTLEGLTLA